MFFAGAGTVKNCGSRSNMSELVFSLLKIWHAPPSLRGTRDSPAPATLQLYISFQCPISSSRLYGSQGCVIYSYSSAFFFFFFFFSVAGVSGATSAGAMDFFFFFLGVLVSSSTGSGAGSGAAASLFLFFFFFGSSAAAGAAGSERGLWVRHG